MNDSLNKQERKRTGPLNLLMHIPVPWIYVLVYLTGLVPQFLITVNIPPENASFIIKIAGIVLFVTGAILAAWSLIIFHQARTTTTPGESSKILITAGLYRFSRNPMYISLFLAYLGEAGILVWIWPVILMPPIFVYFNRVIIPVEEEILKMDFGEACESYCSRVHRWF